MTGGISAISPTAASLAQANASCDAGPHLAAWMVTVTGGDGSVQLPGLRRPDSGYRDAVRRLQAGRLLPFAGHRPAGSPDQGNKFVTMALKVRGFTVPTKPGHYTWRSLWTPFAVNTANLNTAGNVEAQSTQSIGTNALAISGKSPRSRCTASYVPGSHSPARSSAESRRRTSALPSITDRRRRNSSRWVAQ